jgi:hypothetical protein
MLACLSVPYPGSFSSVVPDQPGADNFFRAGRRPEDERASSFLAASYLAGGRGARLGADIFLPGPRAARPAGTDF